MVLFLLFYLFSVSFAWLLSAPPACQCWGALALFSVITHFLSELI